jgi:DNA helicase-2/ATP-dependent DNA helicase PcrA
MKPSIYQEAIFDFVKNGSGSAVVEAVAGSGKTTTVLASLKLIPKNQSVLLLAFNKSIADELKKKAPEHVDVKTFNGYGHRILCQQFGKINLEANKMRKIVREVMDGYDYGEFGEHVLALVNYAKRMGILPDGIRGMSLLPDTDETWNNLIDRFGIAIRSSDRHMAINYAKQCIVKSLNMVTTQNIVDFDDQIYIPIVKSFTGDTYDWVFVDEAQDMSLIRSAMVKMAVKPNGRVIAVGDISQAIYGFTGADSESLNNFKKDFNAISLPLSISYRCAKKVVAEAKRIVPHIEAFESAPDGEIKRFEDKFSLTDFKGGDMILCRRNAPVVSLAFKLIKAGIPAKILGRDISTGLIKLIESLKPKGIHGSHGLVEKLSAWRLKEVNKWNNEDRPDMVEMINDKNGCILAIINKSTVNTVPDLIRDIESLFSDDVNNTRSVILCSIHKAKGLEAETVYFLDRDLIPSKFARQSWEFEQENNLIYVGVTRAKHNLNYIYSDRII